MWRILFYFQALFSQHKKAPAHHISVKGRGLLLLDFNSVWGDKTTFSFYRVSVPFQIFNHPRVLYRCSPALFWHTSLQPVSYHWLFIRHNADIHKPARHCQRPRNPHCTIISSDHTQTQALIYQSSTNSY